MKIMVTAILACMLAAIAPEARAAHVAPSPEIAESSPEGQSPRPSRKRPSAMRHTQAEVDNVRKITKVNAAYIRDGARFAGNVYMTGDAGAIKIGDAALSFRGGKYYLAYDAASFEMRKSSTRYDREKEGISELEYELSWRDEKLGQDFDHSGNYSVEEQYGQINLILYDGTTDSVFAKISLESASDSSFEFSEDGFLIQFTHIR